MELRVDTDTPRFERVAIVGLGLLGGSVALAMKQRGLCAQVVAAGRRQAPLEAARDAGIVDAIGTLEEMVRGADLVVLGTPVQVMPKIAAQMAEVLAPGTLVTDVGSVKQPLVEQVPAHLPEGVHFVGSHPMAGSHQTGALNARADLFEGCTCAVTPVPSTDEGALSRVSALWRALGAEVVLTDPVLHDEEVAWTSHAPHLFAFAFAKALESAPSRIGRLAGGGFRDFTRIARSGAELWGEILVENRKALAEPLQVYGEALTELGRELQDGDAVALERSLAKARKALAEVSERARRENPAAAAKEARSGGPIPEIQAGPGSSAMRGKRDETATKESESTIHE